MLGFMTMIGILQRLLRRKASGQYVLIKMILRRIEIFMRWNLVVLLVICNVDEVILYGISEWKNVSVDSAQDFISFLVSLAMAIVSLSVLITPFYFLHKIYKARFKVLSNQANEPYFDLLRKIERFQLLWKDFKDSSWPQKAFLSIYVFRILLIYMIIGFLYKRPLLQTVLIFSMSLGMLTFMSIVKPFMKKLDFIQSVIYEVCMLISTGSMLILAALHRTHIKAEQLWLFLGDCIMFCHIFISFTAVFFFTIKFLLEVQRVWKFYKTIPKPIKWREFAVLFLNEDDPVIQELKKNKRTSRKLDLTGLEMEIEKRNFEKYNIKLTSSSETPRSRDEGQLNYIPRKGDLRIRRSLFGMKIQSSDSENSPFRTNSTLDEAQSPRSGVLIENLKLSNKIKILNEMKKNLQEISPPPKEEKYEKKASSELLFDEKINGDYTANRRKLGWRLETIKELDSIEASETRNCLQMKRLGQTIQDPLRADLSLISIVNKRLSSDTMQKTEEIEILKEKADLVKKRMMAKEDVPSSDSVFG